MRGAIFDMDGLLIDSERIWQRFFHEAAAERGITLPESFPREICGTGGEESRRVLGLHFPGCDPEALLRAVSAQVHREEENGVPLKPGAEAILRGLRGAGYRLAVASSSPQEMIRHNLRLDGVDTLFHVLTSGREAAHPKPQPDVFLLAAERLGLPPEECWVFEDSFRGVEAGSRAGCRVVMVPDQAPPTEEIRALCFAVCRDLNEALRIVSENP